MVLCQSAIPSHMPLVTPTRSAVPAAWSPAAAKATAAIFTASRRADAAFTAGAGRLSTVLAAILAADRTATVAMRIGAVSIQQEQPVNDRAATGHSQHGYGKQAGRKVSHGFGYPGQVRPSGPTWTAHQMPLSKATTAATTSGIGQTGSND